jgi:hypothetical protein
MGSDCTVATDETNSFFYLAAETNQPYSLRTDQMKVFSDTQMKDVIASRITIFIGGDRIRSPRNARDEDKTGGTGIWRIQEY